MYIRGEKKKKGRSVAFDTRSWPGVRNWLELCAFRGVCGYLQVTLHVTLVFSTRQYKNILAVADDLSLIKLIFFVAV